ncbi:syndecan-4 isoform X2 [Pungitius pungitius]|uniref:syndecan-4 isoform X2 n=1 Tax=Pungitius pungitius TaxID=134920 RepID=UPI002E0E23A5
MRTMLSICLVLVLSASALSESVRETETWMPMKTTQTVAMSTRHNSMESSGDSPNGSDFGFTNGEDDETEYGDEEEEDEEDDYNEFSGSGDGVTTVSPLGESKPSVQPDVNDNKIPEVRSPTRPAVDQEDTVKGDNEIPTLTKEAESPNEHPSNVLMAHAGDDSIFAKTEVFAALIAGGAVGLMLAVLLILLLIYRMKKKDEGSYDLGKKPIYKKAPTTEIYA